MLMLNQSGGTQAASDIGLTGDGCGALQDLVQSADVHDSLICWVNVRAAGEDCSDARPQSPTICNIVKVEEQ
jgi:hypothetical protein